MQGEVGFTFRSRLQPASSVVVIGSRTASVIRIDVHGRASRISLRPVCKISCVHFLALLCFVCVTEPRRF